MAKAYYIPNGPKNLQSIFPDLNFEDIAEYYVELVDMLDVVVATSPMNQLCGCENDTDCVRLHFLNRVGGIDAIQFRKKAVEHEAKSESYTSPVAIPYNRLAHAKNRFNVKSNDTILASTIDYGEDDMNWIEELLDSSLVWVEVPVSQGQPAGLVPVVILDKKFQKFKQEDRHTYEVEIEYTYSHDNFNIRN